MIISNRAQCILWTHRLADSGHASHELRTATRVVKELQKLARLVRDFDSFPKSVDMKLM